MRSVTSCILSTQTRAPFHAGEIGQCPGPVKQDIGTVYSGVG